MEEQILQAIAVQQETLSLAREFSPTDAIIIIDRIEGLEQELKHLHEQQYQQLRHASPGK